MKAFGLVTVIRTMPSRSNTEPLLRLNIEAKTQPLMEQKRDEVVTFIRQ